MFATLFGLVIGSFLNVCIYRIPKGESVVYPSSHCPVCGTRLRARDLVPVFSYIMLRGRCRVCGARFSLRYAVVEALTGLAFYYAAWSASGALETVKFAILFSALIAVFFIDLDHQIIPNAIVLLGVVAGIVIALMEHRVVDALTGMAVGFFGFYALAVIATALMRKEAMGGGDIKFAGMLGVYLGWENLLLAMFLAFFLGAAAAPPLMLLGRKGIKDPVPFGPMMCAGTAITVAAGPKLLQMYGVLLERIWA